MFHVSGMSKVKGLITAALGFGHVLIFVFLLPNSKLKPCILRPTSFGWPGLTGYSLGTKSWPVLVRGEVRAFCSPQGAAPVPEAWRCGYRSLTRLTLASLPSSGP